MAAELIKKNSDRSRIRVQSTLELVGPDSETEAETLGTIMVKESHRSLCREVMSFMKKR